jgi:hypothetical protein
MLASFPESPVDGRGRLGSQDVEVVRQRIRKSAQPKGSALLQGFARGDLA